MNKMKLLAAAAALTVALSTQSFAGGTDVVIHSDAWGVDQLAGSGAFASMKADSDAVNIAGLSSLEGNGIKNAFVHADAANIRQGAISIAVAPGCGKCGKGGIANATATNMAGVAIADVDTVSSRYRSRYYRPSTPYVHVGASAFGVTQIAGSLAIAGKNATANAANLAAVSSVTVNVD